MIEFATERAYQEGTQACYLGQGKFENPYRRGTVLHDLWLNGWNDEYKRFY